MGAYPGKKSVENQKIVIGINKTKEYPSMKQLDGIVWQNNPTSPSSISKNKFHRGILADAHLTSNSATFTTQHSKSGNAHSKFE